MCVHCGEQGGGALMTHHVVVDDFLKALSTFLQKILQTHTLYITYINIIHPVITASQDEPI